MAMLTIEQVVKDSEGEWRGGRSGRGGWTGGRGGMTGS